MKPKPNLKLSVHSNDGTLSQIYTGFFELQKKGLINLEIGFSKDFRFDKKNTHYVEALLDNKIKIIYETLDNAERFCKDIESIEPDYYFKRSFNPKFVDQKYSNICFLPLGLNYFVTSQNNAIKPLGKKVTDYFENLKFVKSFHLDKYLFSSSIGEFESEPIPLEEPKILFMTRAWSTDDEADHEIIKDRNEVNESRAEIIRICRKQFGDLFTGGFEITEFSARKYPDCLLSSNKYYNRKVYLKIMKSSNICISSRGLQNSTGWKMAEYVAASKAIVSEPLSGVLPGVFSPNKNYLEYSDKSTLISQIQFLIENKNIAESIMTENNKYYKNYLIPDRLVSNTLVAILDNQR